MSKVAGVSVAPVFVVDPFMWLAPLVTVLSVVVLGGLGSIHGSVIGALVMTAIVCILLGCGVPTTANYLIMVTIAAPALAMLGVPQLVSHFFVFYYGVLADITRILADLSISIDAMVQKEPGEGEEQVDIIMLTHLTLEKNIVAAIARVEGLPVNLGRVTRIRLEELAA